MVSGKCGAAWLKLELVPTTRQSRRSQASARQNGTSYFDAPMTHCSSHRRIFATKSATSGLAPQQTASLDHLVGRHEQRGGNVDAERLRSHLLRMTSLKPAVASIARRRISNPGGSRSKGGGTTV